MSYPCKQLKNNLSLHHQRGTVIVMALFIVALAAALSYTMMTRLARDTARTSLILRNMQAEFYAQGGIAWAMDTLTQDWEKQKPNQTIDLTPIQSPVDKVHGYQITSTIYNIQSRYNINNLTNPDVQIDFQRLLQTVMPALAAADALNIARAITDWISPPYTQQNEYAQYYSGLPVPYSPAHRPMISISEMQLVKGMTPALFAKAVPYLTALPSGTQTNMRQAPVPVLMALSKTMTLEAAKALAEWFAKTKNVTTDMIMSLDVFRNNQISSDKVIVTSQFFLLQTEVIIEKQRLVLYTLLERRVNGQKALVRIVWQSKNLEA